VRTSMQERTEIRRKVLVDGASKRQIMREYGISYETLQRMLSHPEPPGYRLSVPRPKPKLEPYLGVIDEMLTADRDAPPKQHHTAKRVFERLRDEHGYDGVKGSRIPSHHAAHRYSWTRPPSTSFRATCFPRGLPVGGACMPAGVARSSPRCGRCSV
jgi:transposase